MTKNKFPETEGPILEHEGGNISSSFKNELGKQWTIEDVKKFTASMQGKSGEGIEGAAESPFLTVDDYRALPQSVLESIFINPDQVYETKGFAIGRSNKLVDCGVIGSALSQKQIKEIIEEKLKKIEFSEVKVERSPERSREKGFMEELNKTRNIILLKSRGVGSSYAMANAVLESVMKNTI